MHKEDDLLDYAYDPWGNPDVCQRYVEEKGAEMLYRVSVPQDWIQSTMSMGLVCNWITDELKPEHTISEPTTVINQTVIHSGLMNFYYHPWAWVKTNENGALELLFKLGYVIHESIYGSMVDEIREIAKFHSIDIRLIEFKYGLLLSSFMCLRNEEDAALLRLCIS